VSVFGWFDLVVLYVALLACCVWAEAIARFDEVPVPKEVP
jgi:hypothetical protein